MVFITLIVVLLKETDACHFYRLMLCFGGEVGEREPRLLLARTARFH